MDKEIQLIIKTYSKNREKIKPILLAFRTSRKYGFPVINAMSDKTEEEQYIWAIKFLLSLSDISLNDESATSDDEFNQEIIAIYQGTLLHEDCRSILSLANGNTINDEINKKNIFLFGRTFNTKPILHTQKPSDLSKIYTKDS